MLNCAAAYTASSQLLAYWHRKYRLIVRFLLILILELELLAFGAQVTHMLS